MKIGGRPINGLHEVFLVLREGDDAIVIRARAVPNFDEFNVLCPEPKAPIVFGPNGSEPNFKDVNYRSVKAIYDEKMMAYITIKSLEPSQIEWDTVDINNSSTWTNWKMDLQNAGIAPMEINRISNLILEANCLDDAKIAAARELFLKGQQMAREKSASQNTDQANMPSGAPVSV